MVPAPEAMTSPAGRPLADQVRLAPLWVSVALRCRAVMALPDRSDWLAGVLTLTAPVMAQVKLAEPEKAELSVTARVTG